MDRPVLAGIVLALLFVVLILMALGWQARKRRQSGFSEPHRTPTDFGPVLAEFEAFYVATTVAGERLNRVAVQGLGFRSRASVTVAGSGVVLALRGEQDVFIPAADIRTVTRATWTIDRVVEAGGLVLLGWNLGDDAVDSYLRLDDSQALIDAIISVRPSAAVPPGTTTTEGEA